MSDGDEENNRPGKVFPCEHLPVFIADLRDKKVLLRTEAPYRSTNWGEEFQTYLADILDKAIKS